MKRFACLLMALCLLLGAAGASLAESRLEGKPWINTSIPGNIPAQKPALEEHYELHVNFDLHQHATAGSEAGPFAQSKQLVSDRLWNLIDTGESVDAQTLRRLTSLITDGDRREKEGMEPLMAYVRQVRETKSVEELSALCRKENFLFGNAFAIVQITNSSGTFLWILEPNTSPVPQVEEQEDQPDGAEPVLNTELVEKELQQLGFPNPKELTQRLVQYQKDAQSYTPAATEAEDLSDGKTTAAEIQKLCAPLYDQLISLGLISETKTGIYEIGSREGFQYIQEQYKDENLELFQALVSLGMLEYAQPYLNAEAYNQKNGLTGTPDWKQVATNWMFGGLYLAEQLYSDAEISAEQRAEVEELIRQYKQLIAERFQKCEWLSEESRGNLLEKLDKMGVYIVGQGAHFDYAPLLQKLSDSSVNLLQAAILYDQANRQRMMLLAGESAASGKYFLTGGMLDPDAFYDPNNFFVQAGALTGDLCNRSSRETLLATIGQTIAHEINHAFDPTNIQYRADGMPSLLTEQDYAAYTERMQRLVDELNRVEYADQLFLNGQKVLGEVIPDLCGLRVTLDLAAQTEGFDYDLFFRTLAKKFFYVLPTREKALERFADDLHPPTYIRVNYIFQKMDEFYRTYPSVREGTPMYAAPADRYNIW